MDNSNRDDRDKARIVFQVAVLLEEIMREKGKCICAISLNTLIPFLRGVFDIDPCDKDTVSKINRFAIEPCPNHACGDHGYIYTVIGYKHIPLDQFFASITQLMRERRDQQEAALSQEN